MTRPYLQREFEAAWRQRLDVPRGARPASDADERRYHRAMATLCAASGAPNLAGSHLVAMRDCPRGCSCEGCAWTAEDRAEQKAMRAGRRVRVEAT